MESRSERGAGPFYVGLYRRPGDTGTIRSRGAPTRFLIPQFSPAATHFPAIPLDVIVLPSSLTVSVVTYRPDLALLERCLVKLALAIKAARADGAIENVALALIDNS